MVLRARDARRAFVQAGALRGAKTAGRRRGRVYDYGAGIRESARSGYALSGASRQTNQSKNRALHTLRMGTVAATGAGRVHPRNPQVSLRALTGGSYRRLYFAIL